MRSIDDRVKPVEPASGNHEDQRSDAVLGQEALNQDEQEGSDQGMPVFGQNIINPLNIRQYVEYSIRSRSMRSGDSGKRKPLPFEGSNRKNGSGHRSTRRAIDASMNASRSAPQADRHVLRFQITLQPFHAQFAAQA